MLTVTDSLPVMMSTVDELEASYTGATSELLDADLDDDVDADLTDEVELPCTGATDTVLYADVDEVLADELL